MASSETVVLTADGMTVRLPSEFENADDTGLFLAADGIEGWYSTPTPKVSMTERGQGDGAHDLSRADIMYSARTVIAHFVVNAWADRNTIVSALHDLSRMAGRIVRMTFDDGGVSSYVEGYLSVEAADAAWSEDWSGPDTFTLVCPRPERLATMVQRYQLWPVADSGGGLWFEGGSKGLSFPLRFGDHETSAMNTCTVTNNGSYRAHPVFTANGRFPDGVILSFGGDRILQYSAPVWPGTPLTLDSRSRTASMNGVDVSRNLTARAFPTVAPRNSLACTLLSLGDGWVTVESQDTWM